MAATTNGYFYKPAIGASGAAQLALFDAALDATDAVIALNVAARHTQNTDTGTTGSTFQIDSDATGPKIKNSSGETQIRNAGDTDDANLKAGYVNAVDGFKQNGTALAATNLTQNGTGTTAASFKVDSDGDETADTCTLLYGAGVTQAVGVRIVAGLLQYRNYGDSDWKSVNSQPVIPVASTLTTGDKGPWLGPIIYPRTVVAVKASVKTASTATAVQVDIEKSTDNGATWATIMTAPITIDINELTTTTAATPAVIDSAEASLAAGNILRIYIDVTGTGTTDLSVILGLR